MATKSDKTPWEPPRGMWYEDRPAARHEPFYLFWRDGKKKRFLRYKDAAARETAARSLAAERAEHGASVIAQFDVEKWKRWLEFEKIVGEGVDPVVVAAEWKAQKQGRSSSLVGLWVQEAVTKYFAIRKAEKSWSRDCERHQEKHLQKSFQPFFVEKRINEIEADDIRAWLASLKLKNGQPVHAITTRDYRKSALQFFAYAKREGWVLNSPVEAVKPPKVAQKDVHVISVREAFEFFRANRDQRCIGRIALEAFGGVRYSTAGRLKEEGLILEQKGIRMQGKTHKSGKTRYRQGQPDNLWAWIEHAPDSCWETTELQYREEKRYAAIRSGLRPDSGGDPETRSRFLQIKNIWRHSFASYHLAKYKQVPLTQYLMQHTNAQITEVYEGVASEADAKLYFSITPDAVSLEWNQFVDGVQCS